MNKRAGMTAADIVNNYEEDDWRMCSTCTENWKNSRKHGFGTSKGTCTKANRNYRRLSGNYQNRCLARNGKRKNWQKYFKPCA